MEVMHRLSNVDSLTKDCLAIVTAECPVYQQQRPTLNFQYHYLIIIQLPGGCSVTLDCFHPGRDDFFVVVALFFCFIPGIDAYSGYGFAQLAHSNSAKITIHRLIECLIPYLGILHSIRSDKGNHFISKQVWQQVNAHGIHWSYRDPKAADLTQ